MGRPHGVDEVGHLAAHSHPEHGNEDSEHPMILLSARDLSRQFDAAPVFQGVGFDIRTGERIGLVGPNGAGKTTLLKILAGLDDPDAGQIERHPSAASALLEQEPEFPPERTLFEEARAGLEHLYALQTEAAELAEQIAVEADQTTLERLQRRFDRLQQDLHRLDAYNIDHRVDEVLDGLGFREDEYDRPLVQFSGGQQSRAMLARLLLRSSRLMLLDEPTNHLDIAATEWLEEYLSRSHQAMVLVSHDRYFLDRVTNRILELSAGTLTDYRGNFSAYWTQREERHKVLQRTYEKQQEFIEKTEDFIRRHKYGQKHAQAADREKKLSRLERVERPRQLAGLPMSFGQPSRTGDWVIEALGVAKGFGTHPSFPSSSLGTRETPLFTDVNLRVERGDRIGIFGPNGSGKTTLLRTLLGDLPPDEGTVRLGAGVKIGYFDQQLESIEPHWDAVEAVRPSHDPAATPAKMRQLLARFGIRGDRAFQTVGSMSGGEKSKVVLARIAAENVNLLVLDEPTNHLDLWARASLELALKEFAGTLLFVSHDRYFLDRVAASVVVLEPPHWRFYAGNYSAYVSFRKSTVGQAFQPAAVDRQAGKPAPHSTQAQQTQPKDAAPEDGLKTRRRRFPYRKVEDLEVEIVEQESLLEQLQADLSNPAVHRDGRRVKQITEQYDETRTRLEHLYEHWEESLELN